MGRTSPGLPFLMTILNHGWFWRPWWAHASKDSHSSRCIEVTLLEMTPTFPLAVADPEGVHGVRSNRHSPFLKIPWKRNNSVSVRPNYFVFTNENNNGPCRKKTCLRGFAKNTGADQPAHPRSLISAFFIRFLESIVCKLATGEISIF